MHAALGDVHRLAVVEELALADRTPSELAAMLGIESNLLAHHLKVLLDVGLVERLVSDGDKRRRYVRLRRCDVMNAGRILTAGNVVFVCTRNSARSQLAAALWNAEHPVRATSGGTEPAEHVHPKAVEVGTAAGIDLRGAVPRRLADLEVEPDLVITVCDRAHETLGRGARRQLHWSLPDPARDGRRQAFELTVRRLIDRIGAVGPAVRPISP